MQLATKLLVAKLLTSSVFCECAKKHRRCAHRPNDASKEAAIWGQEAVVQGHLGLTLLIGMGGVVQAEPLSKHPDEFVKQLKRLYLPVCCRYGLDPHRLKRVSPGLGVVKPVRAGVVPIAVELYVRVEFWEVEVALEVAGSQKPLYVSVYGNDLIGMQRERPPLPPSSAGNPRLMPKNTSIGDASPSTTCSKAARAFRIP